MNRKYEKHTWLLTLLIASDIAIYGTPLKISRVRRYMVYFAMFIPSNDGNWNTVTINTCNIIIKLA
jgi:hypothetical protein